MILVGLDDTDTLETRGTNFIARSLVARLGDSLGPAMVTRHQLLFDPRIPYTSHNGSAAILFAEADPRDAPALVGEVREALQEWYVEGSDPGFCVATEVPPEIAAFGRRCQEAIVEQKEARDLAKRAGIPLEGIGGTEGGVIGALAGIGLASTGDDGRVVHLSGWPWPDRIAGPIAFEELTARGVAAVQVDGSDEMVTGGVIDVGKRLRPNLRGGRIVLFVVRAPADAGSGWLAVRRN